MILNRQKMVTLFVISVSITFFSLGCSMYFFYKNSGKSPGVLGASRFRRENPITKFFYPKTCIPNHPDQKICAGAENEKNATLCLKKGCCPDLQNVGGPYCFSKVIDRGQRVMHVFAVAAGCVLLIVLIPIVGCRMMQESKTFNSLLMPNKDVEEAKMKARMEFEVKRRSDKSQDLSSESEDGTVDPK